MMNKCAPNSCILSTLSLSLIVGTTMAISPVYSLPAFADSRAALGALTVNSIADIAEKSAPAVVNIDILPTADRTSKIFGGRQLAPDTKIRVYGRTMKFQDFLDNLNIGTGTGFVVRDTGYIVTNNHVVKEPGRIKVSFQNGKTYDATIVGTDSLTDLAVLKIDAKNLPILEFGSSAEVRPGEFSIAIGSPLGYKYTVTFGIISAVGQDVQPINENINFIQTDAAINKGNSGGPLINMKGEVIGINTAIITANMAQNIGFAIPADIAKGVIDDLISDKMVHRPWIGIAMKEVTADLSESLSLPPDTRGVVVMEVYKNSPAIGAGIIAKDIIQKLDSKTVVSPKQVKDFILSHRVDQSIKVTLLRDGRPIEVSIKIGKYPEITSQN